MSVKETKDGKSGLKFLRWPWNVVIYIVLIVALRIFAVPVILLLMGMQRKNNPHGVEEGYCLTRTRKKLTWCLWAVILLVLAAGLGVMFYVGLRQDRTYWETKDYVVLVVSGGGAAFLLALGIGLGYMGIRDAFFPEKGTLAQSIRNQLPFPDGAPPVDELFAMVDNDLKENATWFGEVGIGAEWVLGDEANRIDRIRGIFTVDKIRQRSTQTGTRTSRVLELVLIDNRWHKSVTDFKDPQDLRDAAEFLALRVPDAVRGVNDQYGDFLKKNDIERENFEREFQQKQNLRASEQALKKAGNSGTQEMILEAADGTVTSRVTLSLVEEHLRRCLSGEEGFFVLTAVRPVEAGSQAVKAVRCYAREENAGEERVMLAVEPVSGDEGETLLRVLTADRWEAKKILEDWLKRQAPDVADWQLAMQARAPRDGQAGFRQRPQARLSLVLKSGAAENHTTFTREDVQVAADGLADGTYQLVDLTLPQGYLWIRATAGDKMDGRCTVEATRPDGSILRFYSAKMSPREAASWLTGYPGGEFQPGGKGWKDCTKQMMKGNKK